MTPNSIVYNFILFCDKCINNCLGIVIRLGFEVMNKLLGKTLHRDDCVKKQQGIYEIRIAWQFDRHNKKGS